MNWKSFLKKYQKRYKKLPYNEMLKKASTAYKRKRKKSFKKSFKKKNEEVLKYNYFNNIGLQNILVYWNECLNKYNGVHPDPCYPLHPLTRELIHPIEIYDIAKSIFLKRKNNAVIEIPLAVLFFINDIENVTKSYETFKVNLQAGKENLRNYFFNRGVKYGNQWIITNVRQLDETYVDKALQYVTAKYPDDVSQVIKKVKTPVKTTFSLVDVKTKEELLKLIKKKPKILNDICDFDCQYFGISKDEHDLLKEIVQSKNYKERLDNFFNEEPNKLKRYAKGTVVEFFTGIKIILSKLIKN